MGGLMSARFRLRANPFKGKGVMSLAENLASEMAAKPSGCVICAWLPTLNAKDREAFYGFRSLVIAEKATQAQVWRACTASGLSMKYKRFVDNYRNDCHVAH